MTTCNGAQQKGALMTMNDQPTNLVENAGFVLLPGVFVQFPGPAMGTDQVIVTFSAEASLVGQDLTYVVPADSMGIEVLLDGVILPPLNDVTFNTDVGEAVAVQGCKRVGQGMHTVRVEWLLVDQNANNVLTGTLDDWAVHVEINE